MNDLVSNSPIATTPKVQGGALASVLGQREFAEMQAAVFLAKQFPRELTIVRKSILDDCSRKSLAEDSYYSYSRGGTEIEGASIKLLEAIAQKWQNLRWGWQEVSRNNGSSEIECWAWDLESNAKPTIKFTVKHWRDTRSGGYALKDERDIYELCANQAARRVRKCLESVIPSDIIEEARIACKETLTSQEPATKENIDKYLKGFEQFGVTRKQIEKRFGRDVYSLQPAMLVRLNRIGKAIREGITTPENEFEPEEEAQKPAIKSDNQASAIKDKIAKNTAKVEPKTESAPTPSLAPTDQPKESFAEMATRFEEQQKVKPDNKLI